MIYIGTSGWVYKQWAKTFYPKEVPAKERFGFYAKHFPTVEINATFYRLPTEKATEGWHTQSPPGFLYAVKGSRTVTHYKKLQPGAKSFDLLFDRLKPLRKELAVMLWQLPGNFHKDAPRLKAFVATLPGHTRHAVEFRHPSWLDGEIYDILRERNIACASLSSQAMPMDFTVTADFLYVRFHGLQGGAAHDYTEAELKPWARHLLGNAEHGRPAYVYFNNDINTRAPGNALTLMRMVGEYANKAG